MGDRDIFGFPQYSRPSGNKKLFTSSGNRENDVIIGGNDNDWDLYCMGYWRAADSLVDLLTQKHDSSIQRPYAPYWESQAYAILFLYRHYLELRLKEMLLLYCVDSARIEGNHSLMNLWKLLLEKDKTAQIENPSQEVLVDLDVAEKIIKEFDEIDSNSQAFRYPKDRIGKLTIKRMQIDLIRLKKALGWLSQFLEGWSCGIYEYEHAYRE